MAKKIKAKALISVDVPIPDRAIKTGKADERLQMRNDVEDSLLVALEGMNPKIQRLNLSRDKKEGKNDE